MLKKIYQELVAIRKELQAIKSSMESGSKINEKVKATQAQTLFV